MKVSWLTACALFMALQPGRAAQSIEQQVAAADRSWADFYQSCNIEGMNRLIRQDMVFIHAGGNQQNKTEFVDTVRPCNMELMKTEPTKIRVYGTTAVVIGNMTYKVTGMPAPGHIVYTRVYVNDGGKWSLVSHQ